jgi:hypothetical protein
MEITPRRRGVADGDDAAVRLQDYAIGRGVGRSQVRGDETA